MKKVKALAAVALAGSVLAGFGVEREELRIYTWRDYIAPEVIARFEKANNCKVVVDTFDSNEAMFAKLKAGAAGHDIIMPSSYQIPLMERSGMIQALDHAKLPHVRRNFDRRFAVNILDPSFFMSVPYAVTYTGIAYRKDKVGAAPVNSWKVFETPALKGRMSLLDDMRETIGAGLMCLGYSMNSSEPAQIAKAADVVIGWKRNVATFDNEQYKTAVASGEWLAGHGYSSDVIQVMLDNANVGFALPKEGFAIACDEMVIAAGSKKVDLAHKFIDFCYDPDVAAANMRKICAPMPVAGAFAKLEEKLRDILLLDPAALKEGEVIRDFSDQPEVQSLYVGAWERIKSAK